MGSDSPSAASGCGPGDPLILSERSCSMSNAFFVANDDWAQGLVPSPATLVGHVGLPWAVFPRAFPLTRLLQVCFLSGLVPGILLGLCPVESMIPDVHGAVLISAQPCDHPSSGPWLQGPR